MWRGMNTVHAEAAAAAVRRWRQQGLAEAFAAWAGARAEQRRVRRIEARVLALRPLRLPLRLRQ